MGKRDKVPEHEYTKVPTMQVIADKQEVIARYGYGVRHIQLLILFLVVTVNFIARGHMGVTVVSMTSPPKEPLIVIDKNITKIVIVDNVTNVQGPVKANTIIEDIYDNVFNNESNFITHVENATDTYHSTFEWPKSTQEMILGSFFLGYCIMTLPMGLVVQRWGGKIPLQIALSINGIVSILTPWLTNWGGWKAVCACRIAQGLSQAGVFPSIQNILSKWVPVSERGTFASYAYTGSTLGTVVAFQMSGFLCDSRWGWPSTFWAVGLISLVLTVVLTVFGAASPSDHKRISKEEKAYILGRVDDGIVRRHKVPWKAIITSRPVWGILATHVGSGVSYVFFFTQVPSYIHYILGVNVKGSGLLSSLPYMVSFFTSLSFGMLSDYLTNRNIIKVRTARRIFNSISQIGVAIALICTTFTRSTSVAVMCLVFSMGCHMAMHVGWMVNHIDLTPNFSSTLMMMGNTMMNIGNVLLPVLVSYVVTDVNNLTQWRIIFLTIAATAVTTNAIYFLLMSTDTQPWNDCEEKDTYDIEEDQETKEEFEKKVNS